ncbi:TIGR02221 family CRISPR-associated protein [Treponema sp. TIM-1]|uniref:TIGR02221 family CRISPR-associated protein n=1 Tax=Treponema sp. TIM-1 TaxID=2898417 RepID=UPI00398096F2
MSNYTLISFVGTGQYNKKGESEGYKTIKYQFPNGTIYETSLFLEALLQAEYKPVKKIILIGTQTSNWDVLLADMQSNPGGEPGDYTDLWERLVKECEADTTAGITPESRERLEKALTKKTGVPVVIKYHTPEISAATIPEIFPVYSSLVKELAEDTDILLDITHGFRSMPLLVYQALQFGLAGDSQRKVELIYGEIRQDAASPAPARDLSEYWRLSDISAAKNLFFRKFDGRRLAAFLHDAWDEGENLIIRFSTIVECNLSLDMWRWIQDAKRALSRPHKGTEPDWILELQDFLRKEIIKKTDHPLTSDILRAFSRLLEEHNLRTQAIITLQAALETRTVEYYGSVDEIGNYNAWDTTYKNKYRTKRDALSQNGPLCTLEWVRNSIAHGGYKDNRGKAFTSQEVWTALKNCKNAVHEYFEQVNPDKKNADKPPAAGGAGG